MKIRFSVNEMEPSFSVEIEDQEFLDRGDAENAAFYAQEVAEEEFRRNHFISVDNYDELKVYLENLFKKNKK